MIVRSDTHPRLLPLLLLLLLVILCLFAHTAEAKKKVKKTKQSAASTAVTADIDAEPSPPNLHSDALFNDTVQVVTSLEPATAEWVESVDWTALADNMNTSSPTASQPTTTASTHSNTTTPSNTATSTSALFYPIVALTAVASTLGVAYLYYRFLRTTSIAPPPFDTVPLLRLLPPNHPAGRAQGSEWAVEQLRWDEEGDCAHDFLGPFAFVDSDGSKRDEGNGGTEGMEEKAMVKQTAGEVNKGGAKRARKKG